jgi:hypothetical protein
MDSQLLGSLIEAGATILVGVAALSITRRQTDIIKTQNNLQEQGFMLERQRAKYELFHQRFEVYVAIIRYLNAAGVFKQVSEDRGVAFLQAVYAVPFLFGTDVHTFVRAILNKVVEFDRINRELKKLRQQRPFDDPTTQKKIEDLMQKRSELQEYFKAQRRMVRKNFAPYLKVYHQVLDP